MPIPTDLKSRSAVFTGGVSLVKHLTPQLQLGAELTGVFTKAFETARPLRTTGGNYQFMKNATFDFGIVDGENLLPVLVLVCR